MAESADRSPPHDLVARNDELEVDVLPMRLQLSGRLGLPLGLLNHGVEVAALEVIAVAGKIGQVSGLEKLEGLAKSGCAFS